MLTAFNLTRQAWLADELEIADSFLTRLVGLMGRASLSAKSGLWIQQCNSIHTFGMRFPIDLVFLNKSLRVISVVECVRPYRVVWPVRVASSVIELPAHTLRRSGTQAGDVLEIAPLLANKKEPLQEAMGVR